MATQQHKIRDFVRETLRDFYVRLQQAIIPKNLHYDPIPPVDLNKSISVIKKSLDYADIEVRDLSHTKVYELQTINLEAKKHVLGGEYQEKIINSNSFQATSPSISWLITDVDETLNEHLYKGQIAIPFFGVVENEYYVHDENTYNTRPGLGDFLRIRTHIHAYPLDAPLFTASANENTWWERNTPQAHNAGLNNFMGGTDALYYLSLRYGIKDVNNLFHPLTIIHSNTEPFKIDYRNHWTFVNSDYYWKRDSASTIYNVSRQHTALYQTKNLDYNNSPTFSICDAGANPRHVEIEHEDCMIMYGFLGDGYRYSDFNDFNFLIVKEGLIPSNANEFAGGRAGLRRWTGWDAADPRDNGWLEMYTALQTYSTNFLSDPNNLNDIGMGNLFYNG